jgi:phage shock protein B
MDDNITAVLIVLISVLGPIWLVMHYRYKNRSFGRMNAGDAAQLEQIAAVAQRLEARVATLERILDAEAPAWRASMPGAGPENLPPSFAARPAR